MSTILAEVLRRRVWATKTLLSEAPGGPRREREATACRSTRRGAPPHPAGPAPPATDPDDALLRLWSELAWRRVHARRPTEDHDE